jgi:peptide/nickel transport system substrate-binding protein
MKAKELKAWLVAPLALAALLAPAGPALAETVLKMVPHADLRIVDPVWTTGYITRNHGYLVYDTLFALNSKIEPKPQMVESWTVSPDQKVWSFTLRPGLKFHDGSPVRPQDCIASIARWGKRDPAGQKLMEYVAEMAPEGDRGFVLRLKEPFAYVLDAFAKISSNVLFIMREKEASTDAFQQVTEVVGSGPFEFVREEWVPGVKAVYRKFAGYVPRNEPADMAAGGKKANVDRVEWIYLPDGNTAVSALQKGEVDWVEAPLGDLVPVLEKSPGIRVATLDPLGNHGILRFNFLHPPFDNMKARQAVLHATAHVDYMTAVMGSEKYWKPCSSFFPCGTPYEAEAGGLLVKKDLAKARALWKEAGYTGTVLLLDPTDSPYAHQQVLVTAENLKQLGAQVELKAMDWSTMLSARTKKEPPAQGGWNIFHTWTVVPDLMTPLLNNNIRSSGDKAWFGWPTDEKIEAYRDEWLRASSPEAQKAAAAKLAARAFEFLPYVPAGQFTTPTAYRANVTGLIASPVPFFWNVAKGS